MDTPGLGETVQMASVLTNLIGELGKIGMDGAGLVFRGVGGITKGAYVLLQLAIREREKYMRDPTRFRRGDYGMTQMIQMCAAKNIKPQIMRIRNDAQTIKAFEEYARQNKIAYAILPDLNTKDEYIEIMYPSSQSMQYQNFINNINKQHAFSISFDDYLKNATQDKQQEMQQIIENLSSEEKELINNVDKKINGNEASAVNKETRNTNMQLSSKANIERETSSQYVVKLPATTDNFVAIDKKNCKTTDGLIEFNINPAERYQIFDADMNFIDEMSGAELYEDHFSKEPESPVISPTTDKQDIIFEISPEMIKETNGEFVLRTSVGDVAIDRNCKLISSRNGTEKIFVRLEKDSQINTQFGPLEAKDFAGIVQSDRAKNSGRHKMTEVPRKQNMIKKESR